ncbi:hypothetical protein C8J57DRAFT_1529610 [Mycena rebaudengoi]|nr:hypothetical protein C8J57DRAFT_1529610 [Mycena rebaudengoi]
MTKKSNRLKEMFKAYDPSAVPDVMFFPRLSHVASTKAGEVAVPNLNDHQRSWILDVAVRGINLPALKGKAATDFYDQVKADAFDAKAFLHKPQPGDQAEEARLPQIVTAWKRGKNKNTKNTAAGNDNSDDEQEDVGSRGGVLRGYSMAGWRVAIQKVLSNKRGADKRKSQPTNISSDINVKSISDTNTLSKLFGLTFYTGRDKFRDDCHDKIHEYSQSLPGTNTGGNFRKAEALLLHTSGKFRPFVATMLMGWLDVNGELRFEWAEAVPEGICTRNKFEDQFKELVKHHTDSMYVWAEKPLKDYMATFQETPKAASPVFSLPIDDVNEMSPNDVRQIVTQFLTDLYKAAFGTDGVPWTVIVSAPIDYYNSDNFTLDGNALGFPSSGLGEVTMLQWYTLAKVLVNIAGPGTSGFFRKPCGAEDEHPDKPLSHRTSAPPSRPASPKPNTVTPTKPVAPRTSAPPSRPPSPKPNTVAPTEPVAPRMSPAPSRPASPKPSTGAPPPPVPKPLSRRSSHTPSRPASPKPSTGAPPPPVPKPLSHLAFPTPSRPASPKPSTEAPPPPLPKPLSHRASPAPSLRLTTTISRSVSRAASPPAVPANTRKRKAENQLVPEDGGAPIRRQ